MTEQEQRAEFNRWAAEGRGPQMERHHRRITEKTIELMQVRRDDRSIDLGCGSGWATRWLARLAPNGLAVGVDISDEMVRLARRLSVEIENVMFVPGSADQIPWQEDFFSVLLSVESAFYWPEPDRAAGEIFRVMAPGGRVFVLLNFYQENPLSHRWRQALQVPMHLKSAAEWAALFAAAAFDPVQTRQIPDDSPVEADFHGSQWWSSREEEAEFRRIGALLIEAHKPAGSGFGSPPRVIK